MQAGMSDLPEALALIEALLRELGEEGQEFSGMDRLKLESELQRECRSGRFLVLLARDTSGTLVGVLSLSTSFAIYAGGDYGIVDEMYVVPDRRGQGVGRQLLNEAIRIAGERGWFRLDVTGPNAENGEGEDRATRFYRRSGFEPTGQKLRLLTSHTPSIP